MCQFLANFVLETKFVPLFTKASLEDRLKLSNMAAETASIANGETHKNTSCAILYSKKKCYLGYPRT